MDNLSDTESALTSLPDDEDVDMQEPAPIYELVYDRLGTLRTTLSTIVTTKAVSEASKVEAEETVQKLDKELVPMQHKVAIIGRTGAGKSTLVNALLGKQLLSASASGACTAVATEISYKNIRHIEAVVEFISPDKWAKDIAFLLEDIKDTSVDSEEESAPDTEAFSPAYQAKEKLIGIYPHLVNVPPERWDAAELVEDPSVHKLLDTKQELRSDDVQQFQKELEQFLANAFTTEDSRKLWPLVQRVRIMGDFEVLSTGITLVDLPGYGDVDNARDRMASEYLMTADAICLVAGIVRAKDDREIHSHLHKHLNQLILDGRVRDKSISLVLTGADSRIGSNEITLTPKDQARVEHLTWEAKGLDDQLKLVKDKKKKRENTRINNAKKKQDAIKKLDDQIKDLHVRKATKTKEMNNLLAAGRATIVKASLKSKYTEIYSSLSSASHDKTVPNIPIFCVGSRDYMCLAHIDLNEPEIFYDEIETEIPALKQYLQNDGERRTLQQARRVLGSFCSFLITAAVARERDPVKSESKDTRNLKQLAARIDTLEAACRRELETFLAKNDAAYQSLFTVVRSAVAEAAAAAPGVFDKQESKKWNQYRTMMRARGIHSLGNLNADLTETIVPAIQRKWNDTVNAVIPLNNVTFEKDLRRHVMDALPALIKLAPHYNKKLLGLDAYIDGIAATNSQVTTMAQKMGNRQWEPSMQRALTPQYERASKEKGTGMYKRMKALNREYIRASAPALYNQLSDYVVNTFTNAMHNVQHMDSTSVTSFFAMMRTNLLGSAPEPQETGDDLQKFAADHEEECSMLLDKVKERLQELVSQLA